MNKVIITGRLGADPVEHDGENGKFVTYTLANTEWTKNGDNTNWIDVVAFGSSGEFAAKNLSKGKKIILEGRLNTRTYEKDGEKRKSYSVIAVKQEFDEPKKDIDSSKGEEIMQLDPDTVNEISKDLPF